jgi:S-DNA-T family DNA segregation ATPase FtsK/SpoIIIE
MNPNHLATLAKLQLKLTSLGIDGEFLPDVHEGPIVTLYKFVPKNATRVGSVERLAPDLAICLSAEAVQVRRLPGESSIGIYVPNKEKHPLLFRDAVTELWKVKDSFKIPLCLGIDHMGNFVIEDLIGLPHLLIAGSTGGGKSTLLNSILASLIYVKSPTELRFVLCDPKQVEFNHFANAKHLLFPVAYSTIDILKYLDIIVNDIDTRLGTLSRSSCQNISQYNERFPQRQMPYIVVVIDELASPLQDITKDEEGDKRSYGKRTEYSLGKIAEKARATGIHIIAATQRPSVKVVEGNIKANFPARLSFRLTSETDSRTILNTGGAEQLLSQGDALYISPNNPAIRRIHAPLAKIEDIKMAIEMSEVNK